MAFERIGASGESLRVRNSDWFVYRSHNGRKDIKVFRVNELDEIEFMEIPSVDGVSLASQSDIERLEARIAALETALGVVGSAQFNIYATSLTQEVLDAKEIVLPHAPIAGKIVMLVKDTLPQFGDVDFGVSGNIVSWEGYDLPDVLELGDDVRFIYLYHA